MSNNIKISWLFLSIGIGIMTLIMLSRYVFAQPMQQDTSIFLPLVANGNEDPSPETLVPYRMQPFTLHSNVHNGLAKGQEMVFSASFQQRIQVKDAAWLRLFFGDSNLGQASYLEITSLKDGDRQRLYAVDLALREHRSAFFNGDTVEVKLFVAPADTGIFFQVKEIMVGEWPTGVAESNPGQQPFLILPGVEPADAEMVCMPNDDRVGLATNAIGRVMPVGCTAWIVSTGVYLTAGHCVGPDFQELHFHIPGSSATGTPQSPAIAHQYTIVQDSIQSRNAGVGGDWAVFAVQPQLDISTGRRRLPPEAQQSFYRMSRDANPTNFRVTGYGVDGPAPCFGERRQPGCGIPSPTPVPRNSDSQTLQTHVAPSLGEQTNITGTFWDHQVDITGGVSGAPLIDASSTLSLTVGINTHGGGAAICTSSFNKGTSFENDDLEQAIAEFYGRNFVHVDAQHPIASALEDGTVFRPFKLINDGVNDIPNGGTLSIVTGTYNESITITRSMVLTAPVGTVTIVGQ